MPRSPGFSSIIGASLVVGGMAGMFELAVHALQSHRSGLGTLKISRHVGWMIPAVEFLVVPLAVLILTAPVLLWASGRWCGSRPEGRSRVWDWCGTVLGTFLLLGPILAIRGLDAGAALALAVGVGYRLRHLVTRPTRAWIVASRWAGVVAIAIVPCYVGYRWNAVAHAGDRAWAMASPRKTPNLIWIVMDTVRADRMSLYGYARPTTPRLQEWAGRGITFDMARSAASWTLPSHLTMFTGLWPFEHGARVDRPYSGASPTLAEYLAANGYATAGLAANTGMCNACFGLSRGFDYYLDHPCNHDVSVTATMLNSSIGFRVLKLARKLKIRVPRDFPFRLCLTAPEITAIGQRWIEDVERRNTDDKAGVRPYFLFMNVMDAHSPYDPPSGKPRPFGVGAPLPRPKANPTTGWDAMTARDAAPAEAREPRQREFDRVTRQLSDQYDDCLHGLDAELGRFLDGLRDSGRLDDTWVVITSDHGEHFGEHGQFGHGTSLYNELTHVPLVLIPPLRSGGMEAGNPWPRGVRVASPVAQRDLPATMTEVMLPGSPPSFPGRSLSRYWQGSSSTRPDPVLSQLEEQHLEGHDVRTEGVKTMNSVIDEDHILIVDGDSSPQLYHLKDDPRQETNLASDPTQKGRLDRLRRALDTLTKRDATSGPVAQR